MTVWAALFTLLTKLAKTVRSNALSAAQLRTCQWRMIDIRYGSLPHQLQAVD
jgi:hypothetical protein